MKKKKKEILRFLEWNAAMYGNSPKNSTAAEVRVDKYLNQTEYLRNEEKKIKVDTSYKR